jgi:hypothetical protein
MTPNLGEIFPVSFRGSRGILKLAIVAYKVEDSTYLYVTKLIDR